MPRSMTNRARPSVAEAVDRDRMGLSNEMCQFDWQKRKYYNLIGHKQEGSNEFFNNYHI